MTASDQSSISTRGAPPRARGRWLALAEARLTAAGLESSGAFACRTAGAVLDLGSDGLGARGPPALGSWVTGVETKVNAALCFGFLGWR